MDTTTPAAAPVAAQPAQAAPAQAQSSSGVNTNQLVTKFLEMAIAGFAIGMGFILAQKAMGKTIRVTEKSSSTSNMQGPPAYARRMPARGPMIPRQHPMQQPYMHAEGSGFNVNAWIEQPFKDEHINWNEIPD